MGPDGPVHPDSGQRLSGFGTDLPALDRAALRVANHDETVVEAVAQPVPEVRPSRAGSIRVKQYLPWAVLVAVLCVASALMWRGLTGLRLEHPGDEAVSPVETFAIGVRGPIEVSGIRPYYDDEYLAHVRAFVANHSDREQSVALSVLLRVRETGPSAPPLATFRIVIGDPLPPLGGQEVDVPLLAMGSLQSLPRWDEMRVDLEVLTGD